MTEQQQAVTVKAQTTQRNRERKLGRTMIVHVLKRGGTYKWIAEVG